MSKKYFFACFFLLLSGCSSYGPEELDRLTKEDPNFKQMIVARDQMRAQVRAMKDELLAKKQTMDGQVDRLRAEYDAYAKLQNQKMEKLQATVDANRALLQKEIEMAEESMASKETEYDGYNRTLADVKKVLREGKGITFSSQERKKWEEKILLLSEKMRPLKEEIEDLRLQIRLKKQKIHFLH